MAAPALIDLPEQIRRRGDRRFIVDQPAVVYLAQRAGGPWNASIIDISRGGMQLLLDRELPIGVPIRVEWNGRDIHGVVRYQREQGGANRAGIQLSSSWDSLVSDMLAHQADTLRHQANLLDLTYDTIMVTDMGGTIRSWNRGAERMYGWTKAEAEGRNAHDLLHTTFPSDVVDIECALVTMDRWEGELVQTCKDGSRIVVASRWALQRTTDSEPGAIMAINSDITAKKKAEEELVSYAETLRQSLRTAREASEVKSRFLASVSHELRTPLNGIIGFCQLLHDEAIGPVTTDQKGCLEDVLKCSNHLLGLINHVLDLTAIESGKVQFEVEAVDLAELLQDTIDSLGSIAASKEVDVRLHVEPGLETVVTDPARLRQVVMNYLSNALKFSVGGSFVIVSASRAGGSNFRLQVEDCGVGIRLEDMPRLFSEFGQVGVRVGAQAGTGLGLAITKRIVEALGGIVGAESVYGKGSRFYAVLPTRPGGSVISEAAAELIS